MCRLIFCYIVRMTVEESAHGMTGEFFVMRSSEIINMRYTIRYICVLDGSGRHHVPNLVRTGR